MPEPIKHLYYVRHGAGLVTESVVSQPDGEGRLAVESRGLILTVKVSNYSLTPKAAWERYAEFLQKELEREQTLLDGRRLALQASLVRVRVVREDICRTKQEIAKSGQDSGTKSIRRKPKGPPV